VVLVLTSLVTFQASADSKGSRTNNDESSETSADSRESRTNNDESSETSAESRGSRTNNDESSETSPDPEQREQRGSGASAY
jgi:hypothetical protein